MIHRADGDGCKFGRIVLRFESSRCEEKFENLRIGFRGPASEDVEQQKHQESARQTPKQVECPSADTHGEKKQFPLGPQNRQGP